MYMQRAINIRFVTCVSLCRLANVSKLKRYSISISFLQFDEYIIYAFFNCKVQFLQLSQVLGVFLTYTYSLSCMMVLYVCY